MSGTSSAVCIVLIIAIAYVSATFLHAICWDEPIPWRCRAFGSHKFISASVSYVQNHCLRCGYPRKGRDK